MHKQLNLGILYVVVFFIQGFIFKHLFIIFLCMKVRIHTHITIVKCCLGPLLPNKNLNRSNPKCVCSKILSCKIWLSCPLFLKTSFPKGISYISKFKTQDSWPNKHSIRSVLFLNESQHKSELTPMLELLKLMFNHQLMIGGGLFYPTTFGVKKRLFKRSVQCVVKNIFLENFKVLII